MGGLIGRILKNKIDNYRSPTTSTKHRFGFLIDETDPSISNYLTEIIKHPFAKADCKILSFRKKEIPHKYDYSYLKEELPFTKWPVEKEVVSFISHEFDYFFPLINNWQAHHEVICRLVNAKIKFAEAKGEQNIDWDICYNKNTDNPIEFLNFASSFIS